MSELGRHEIVQDRIDGGVGVLHDTRKVEENVVSLDSQALDSIWENDDPEGEDAKGKQTEEKRENHSSQHHDDLSASTLVTGLAGRAGLGVGHKVSGDHGVQHDQHYQRQDEEQ